MNDTKPQRLFDGEAHPDDKKLGRDVRALLASKGGIDESKAKRLRKQWEVRQSQPQNKTGEEEDLAALFVRLRERVHQQVELRDKQFAALEQKLAQLRADLENGDVKQSQQLEQSIVDGLNRMIGLSNHRRQTIITGLEALRPKLHKLTEWRHWGTVQAREKMIAEIKAIHQCGATLPKIAQRIQQARKEWQQWDAAGEGGDKKLYVIFDRACVKAYRPCQDYFDRQKQQREGNTRQRENICEKLEREFEAEQWRDPQWRKIQQSVQAQINQWRSGGKANYQSQKPLQRRFDAIVEKFEERLERERQRNRKIREKLIKDIAQLAEREDTSAALAELQTLKKQWAPTVTCGRAKEQALWKRFTRACDEVYAKRDRERKDQERTLKQNLQAKQTLCQTIEDTSTGDSENHATIQGKLGKWKAQWDGLGEVPKTFAKKINTRYRNAVARAQKVVAQVNAESGMRTQSLLWEKSLICAAIETLALSENPGRKTQREELTARWESLEALPDELERVIGERRRLAMTAADEEEGALKQLTDSLPTHLHALHELLLQLEILTEQDSPAEFSHQRMALQIERLSVAMGKGSSETKSVEELIRDILLLGAVDAKSHRPAFARLECCRRAAGKKTSVPNKTSQAW